MIDLKPFYQSYTTRAHLRWLKGDLDGAIEMMNAAVKAAQPAGSGIRRLGLRAAARCMSSSAAGWPKRSG